MRSSEKVAAGEKKMEPQGTARDEDGWEFYGKVGRIGHFISTSQGF